MRSRNLKPGLFKNELLGSADPLLTILFEGLWCSADREGRLEDRPLRICAEVFPYRRRINEKRTDTMLGWLDRNNFIRRYSVGAQQFIQVLEFKKHQNPHTNEAPSRIPALNSKEHRASTVQAPESLAPKAEAARLIPSSLIPDSLIPLSSEGASTIQAPESGAPEITERQHHERLDRIQAAYPHFTGRQNWIQAQKACRQLIQQHGETYDTLEGGVRRYAAFVAAGGVSGPRHVLTPQTFFTAEDRPWKQDWTPPPVQPERGTGKGGETPAQRDAADLVKLKERRASIGLADFRDPQPGESASDYRKAQNEEWDRRQDEKNRTELQQRVAGAAAAMGMPK